MQIKYTDLINPMLKVIEAAELELQALNQTLIEAELDEDFELEMAVRANIEYRKAVKEATEAAINMVN